MQGKDASSFQVQSRDASDYSRKPMLLDPGYPPLYLAKRTKLEANKLTEPSLNISFISLVGSHMHKNVHNGCGNARKNLAGKERNF